MIIIFSCNKENVDINLSGSWVESSQNKDTIIFEQNSTMLELKRGKELRNGHLVPLLGSGLYIFEIRGDSIGLHASYSSLACCFQHYRYFNYNNQKQIIQIGNFFVDSLGNETILNFSRIDFVK